MDAYLQKSAYGTLLLGLVLAFGCGQGDLPRNVCHGEITCGGEKVDRGSVRFAPIEAGNQLPSTTGLIRDGQYRIEFRGGVPLGKYRVEIYAKDWTGKMIDDGRGQMIEETNPIGPRIYAGPSSPLVAEIKADSDGRYDFAIP